MFKDHPKGLLVLALTNMGEGLDTTLCWLSLRCICKQNSINIGFHHMIYGSFLALVYFTPIWRVLQIKCLVTETVLLYFRDVCRLSLASGSNG